MQKSKKCLNYKSEFALKFNKNILRGHLDQTLFSFKHVMDRLVKKSITDLPDEVIEIIMAFLSFTDLFNLSKEGKKLAECAKRVSKKKPFGK